MAANIRNQIEIIYKEQSGRVLASLFRILGDFDQAEEALHEAFNVALEKWPLEGVPKNPTSWLISVGKFKTLDSKRRLKRGKEIESEIYSEVDEININRDSSDKNLIDDDQLRLIFYCCHPLLPMDSRIALSLRDVCGMKTGEIAHAYLVPNETIKKRISRAKKLFREKNISYEIPSKSEINERMNSVLHVIYLIYNEGYSATSGENLIKKDLTDEAIFLSRKLVDLFSSPESFGLLALLLLHESRRISRVTTEGDLIPLEKQDRSLWNVNQIKEAIQLIHTAIMSGRLGPYTIQAAIASVHAAADSVETTRWDLIINYYDLLLSTHPSPVVELNRAIAVGMYKGAEEGLLLIDKLLDENELKSYHLIYSAKADFSQKLGKLNEAVEAYEAAISLTNQKAEERYLHKKLAEIKK